MRPRDPFAGPMPVTATVEFPQQSWNQRRPPAEYWSVNDAVSDDRLLRRLPPARPMPLPSLFRRRRAGVYRFALHMTGSPATAEDVTQEVFLAVMRDAHRYDPSRATVVAWLCGITRNHVRRRLERDRFLQPLNDDKASALAASHDPLGELARPNASMPSAAR